MPTLSPTINLPFDVQDQITSYAQQIGVDYLVSLALATVLSGGESLAADSSGRQGIMQVTPQQGSELGFDVSDPLQNIQCGLTNLLNQYKAFQNYPLALAAYLTSANTVFQFNAIPPFGNINAFVYNIAALAQRAGCYVLTTKDVINQNKPDASQSTTTVSAITQPQGAVVAPANARAFQNALTTNLQVNDGMNLNAKAWYDTSLGLLTGNPQIRQQAQPISFNIYLSQATGQLLTNPDTQQPIELQLNCSLTQFEIQSKHIYNRTPSRTGQHLTFWGMQPDLINGSGSTGVFMNQYGLTDYFSVTGMPDDIVNSVERAFTDVNSTQNLALLTQPNAFRVAAQDAFVEFLKMFQMNGNVWYYNPNFTVYKEGQDQSQPSGWSPQSGISTAQKNARNNDVHTRGWIAMKFKNNVYLGYFKSLNWTQDAERPFQWQFNFTFQVERTYSALYFPTAFNIGQVPITTSTLSGNL